jgi:hypothetical protein
MIQEYSQENAVHVSSPHCPLRSLQGPWPLLQFRNHFLHRRQACRKAATYTQDNRKTE